MSDKKWYRRLWSVLLGALLVVPGGVFAQSPEKDRRKRSPRSSWTSSSPRSRSTRTPC